ncbi:MAG: hypothetical protein DME94_10945, partial [Verrucomicrobia bacterium]
PLTSQFNIVTRINEDFTGLNYVGEAIGAKGAMSILHVLHPMLLEDESAFKSFRLHIAQLMRVDVVEIMRPKAIKRYADYTAVISDWVTGSTTGAWPNFCGIGLRRPKQSPGAALPSISRRERSARHGADERAGRRQLNHDDGYVR